MKYSQAKKASPVSAPSLPVGWADGLRCLSIHRPWPAAILERGKRFENRRRGAVEWLARFRRPIVGAYLGIYATKSVDTSPWAMEVHPVGDVGVVGVAKVERLASRWGDDCRCAYRTGPCGVILSNVWRLVEPVQPTDFGMRGCQLQGLWSPPEDMRVAIADAPKSYCGGLLPPVRHGRTGV